MALPGREGLLMANAQPCGILWEDVLVSEKMAVKPRRRAGMSGGASTAAAVSYQAWAIARQEYNNSCAA